MASNPAPADHAQALLARGDRAGAIDLARSAAAEGDAPAAMLLAVWQLVGDPLPRDLPAARAALRRAVELGHVDAALMEVALTANGGGAPADWAGALRLLDIAAAQDPVAAAQRTLLDRMALDGSGRPRALPEPRRLSERPDALLFERFFTPEECRHVAEAAMPLLGPSVIVDPKTGRQTAHPIRTSHGAVLGPTREDLVIQALQHRIAAASGSLRAQGEPWSVLHYAPGQQYRPHLDTLPDTANQRIQTAITYLNHGYAGGETVFPLVGLSVPGGAGDMLLFRNVLPDGTPDPQSRHAGAPVLGGAKWIATRWIRAAPYDPWSYSEGR